jgi:hypothetical protein
MFGASAESIPARLLAGEIQKLLTDPQKCQEMVLRGQSAALAYAGNSLWPRHMEVFERATAGVLSRG